MYSKYVKDFKTLECAKQYSLQYNSKDDQIMFIVKYKHDYYQVRSANTDKDISLIIEDLLNYMYDHNCYIVGFSYNYNGWDSNCKTFIEIHY